MSLYWLVDTNQQLCIGLEYTGDRVLRLDFINR